MRGMQKSSGKVTDHDNNCVVVPRTLVAELAKQCRLVEELTNEEKVAAAVWSGLEMDDLPSFVGQIKRCRELLIGGSISEY